ncbi:MAG: hypothetical protein AAGA12_05775 [Pseudomonadota bacterium]
MEQLKNPRELLDAAERKRQTNQLAPTLSQAEPDARQDTPDNAWDRLSEITLDPLTIARNGLSGLSADEAQEPIDQLRTRLVLQMRDKGYRRIGLTSPTRGAGRTTVVGNLALSLSRRKDLRSLVFDFDLANPDLITRFGLEKVGPKFSALEYSRRNFATNCLRLGYNVGLSLHSNPADGSSELLASRKTRNLIDDITTDFDPDIMLFDMPPVLEGDAGLAMLDMLDAVLVVVRADQGTIRQADLAERLVSERCNCLGVILNECRFPPKA